MFLAVQVLLPGSTTLEQVQGLIQKLDKMGLNAQFLTGSLSPIHGVRTKKVADEEEITETLSVAEETLLDKGLRITHERGGSPLLDAMTAARVGRLRPNMSREIISYYQENPGHTTAQAAGNLANKFESHYADINDAFKRIRNLINTMAYAKGGQKALEKRGGRAGRGGEAQVFAVI